jgi:hypothetical protein
MKTRAFPLLLLAALLWAFGARPASAAGAIRVQVSPNVLLADGVSTATVTAQVLGVGGRPARDGTEVRFYTTAGSITPVSFTSAGVARATLTSSGVPQAANVSVSVGIDQSITAVPMVSKLVEANVGGRVLKITGKYVAFSEDKHFIQADQDVTVNFRGVEVQANSVQIDINQDRLVALGKVQIASGEKTLVGERLWLDLKSFEAYMVAVGTKQWFSAYGLTELPERPKNINATFDLVDLTDSKLIWVSKQANYVLGERVQIQGGRAYVGGVKSVRMPFHEANLRTGFGEDHQYVGVGSNGINVDLPIYLAMSPNASTALRLGYGNSSGGIGNFTRTRGLSVDLVQKYGFAGTNEGEASLTNLSSIDRWGFAWNHTQRINPTTRLVTNLQFPEHRDLYGHVNLTSGLPVGTVQMAFAVARPQSTGSFAKTISLAFETKPKPIANGKLNVSAETTFYHRDQQEIRLLRGMKKLDLPDSQYQTAGLKIRPATANLGGGFTLDSSASLRAVTGGPQAGFGPAIDTQLRKQLPRNGYLSVGVNYNHLTSVSDLLPNQGKVNATVSAMYPITNKLRLTAMGNMALDAQSRHGILQASYQINPQWRFDFLHTLVQFGGFGDSDSQFGIARDIGGRELGLYWSRRQHRFIIEFGAGRF